MQEYEIMIEKTHWVVVKADSEDEAYSMAEDMIPTFSSEFEEGEMSITQVSEVE